MSSTDTIFALATAPGKSGVAVLRVSGSRASDVLTALTGIRNLMPRHAHYATLRNESHIIDRGLALYFPMPHSFTGEDVVELHVHGSMAVIRELLELLGQMDGLRQSEPGEFTRRAFINGKMDLIEAEGLADLIDAETGKQKLQALRQMQGELSGFYDGLRARIIRILAHLEAYIDFPDEEIPEEVLTGIGGDIQGLQADIQSGMDDSGRGERLRDGINVVILGAPNAGKSSLLNALACRDAAIVSNRAGTTRDVIEVHLELAGYPMVLVDTAGLRDSEDEIEQEGIRRALARAGQADIKLVLFDGQQPEWDKQSRGLLDARAIAIVTKCDLPSITKGEGAHYLSTMTGEGIDSLLKHLENRIVSFFSSETAPMITRSRHRNLLIEANKYLNMALTDKALELKCEELRRAALCIGKITGKIQVDELLGVIFSQFCIGK